MFEGIKGRAIAKGLLSAFIISIFLSIIITLSLYLTPLSESYLPALASLIFFISILLGSTISAKITGSKGLIHGLGVGISYLLIALLIGVFVANDVFSGGMFIKKVVYTLLGSGLGGIIGVSLSNN